MVPMLRARGGLVLRDCLPLLSEARNCSSRPSFNPERNLALDSVLLRNPANQMDTLMDIGSRSIFNKEDDIFRETVRKFIKQEVQPLQAEFEKNGIATKEIWRKMGENGLYGASIPVEFGGGGGTFKHEAIILEELFYHDCYAPNVAVHSPVVMPYIKHFGTHEQKKWLLPALIAGARLGSLAMTEPNAGSDLQGIKTVAKKSGSDYILNGSKTFISNGLLADTHLVVAVTNPDAKSKAHGLSVCIVEDGMPGFVKGRNLVKVGLKGQDTTELFFDNVRIPSTHILGEADKGFYYVMSSLPQERLTIAVASTAISEHMFEITRDYVCQRIAFNRPLSALQTVQHKLAELKTEISVTRAFTDECIALHSSGACSSATASMAKYWASDVENRVAGACVQLHGGYGYMMEEKIARMFCNARVQTIYGGTNEIMKELIGRTIIKPSYA